MDGPHVQRYSTIRASEDMHSHADTRSEVEVRSVSRRNLVRGINEAALRQQEACCLTSNMGWEVPFQHQRIRTEAINILVSIPKRVVNRRNFGINFKRPVFMLTGKYTTNAATGTNH